MNTPITTEHLNTTESKTHRNLSSESSRVPDGEQYWQPIVVVFVEAGKRLSSGKLIV